MGDVRDVEVGGVRVPAFVEVTSDSPCSPVDAYRAVGRFGYNFFGVSRVEVGSGIRVVFIAASALLQAHIPIGPLQDRVRKGIEENDVKDLMSIVVKKKI